MRDGLERLGSDTSVAVVTFTTDDLLDDYTTRYGLPFPVLRDPDRTAYRAYGIGRTTWRRSWGIRAARRYIEILRERGLRALSRPTEDTRQLGGDVVIDPAGRLSWAHWSDGPDDRPSLDQISEAIARSRN